MSRPVLLQRLKGGLDARGAADVASALAADPTATVEGVAATCDLFAVLAVHDGGAMARVGTMALRIDRNHGAGDDMVIVAAAGRDGGHSLTRDVLPALDDLARASGCTALRLHTAREGFARLLPAMGWQAVETVWRRDLGEVRQVVNG